jgi:hypothetical protein
MAGTLGNLFISQDEAFAIRVDATTYIQQRALAANTAEAIAVPSGAKYVIFGADASFGARYNATLAGTAASFSDVTDGGGCEMNPTIRYLGSVAEISVISAATCNISATFFK